MIFIDTVSQRVLALANKEQRGYVTPQEFNLLANQAQMEIFEEYFYRAKSEDQNLKNSTEFSNVDEMLDEKISHFKSSASLFVMNGIGTLPSDMYRLGSLFYPSTLIEIEQITTEELMYLQQSPLAKPTTEAPAFVRSAESTVTLYPSTITNVNCNYIKTPSKVAWGYNVINSKALYAPQLSVDFNMHKSDETELVYRILSLAGIVMAKPGLGTYADGKITTQQTQEKE